jgi:hypothetical protein
MLVRTKHGLEMIQDRQHGIRNEWLSSSNAAFGHNKTVLIHRSDVLAAGTRDFCEAAKCLLEMP